MTVKKGKQARLERRAKRVIAKLHQVLPDHTARINKAEKRLLSEKSVQVVKVLKSLLLPSSSTNTLPIQAPPITHPPVINAPPMNNPPGNAPPMNNLPVSPSATNPSATTANSMGAQATVLKGYPLRDVAGMLLVGDLLAWTLHKHKQTIWAKCGTAGWEDLWKMWYTEGAPVYMFGSVSSMVRDAIREAEPWWTEGEVDDECRYICDALHLYYHRCELSHDRVSSKGKQELFSWLADVENKIQLGEITFPT